MLAAKSPGCCAVASIVNRRFTMLRGSSAALFYVGAPAAKLLIIPPYPHYRETCAGLFMLFLWHFNPRSEAHSRRVGTGGEAGVTDELELTWLALKLAPWRGSLLVSMARHKSCVHRRAKRQTTRAQLTRGESSKHRCPGQWVRSRGRQSPRRR